MTESGGRLLITDTATGEVVAGHAPAAPGEASVLDEHYGGPRPAPRRAVRPRPRRRRRSWHSGRPLRRSLTGSAASGNTRLAADLGELAALRAAHGEQALLAALERAVAFAAGGPMTSGPSWPSGAGTPQPRPAGDALVIELPAVPVRPLSAYKIGGVS